MNNKILYTVIVILFVIIVGGGTYFFLNNQGQKTGAPDQSNPSSPVACTQEAKVCPDGSSVGRTGPNCEFALCPSETLCEGGLCPSETPGLAAVPDSGPIFVPSGSLSEQPNQAKFDEYLTDIYLGKMALEEKIGVDSFPTKTNIFTTGTDQFCTMITIKKTIPAGKTATAIYNTVAKKYDQLKSSFPIELKAGGIGGCDTLSQSAGQYEYKFYVDDVLAAVLPFEVK